MLDFLNSSQTTDVRVCIFNMRCRKKITKRWRCRIYIWKKERTALCIWWTINRYTSCHRLIITICSLWFRYGTKKKSQAKYDNSSWRSVVLVYCSSVGCLIVYQITLHIRVCFYYCFHRCMQHQTPFHYSQHPVLESRWISLNVWLEQCRTSNQKINWIKKQKKIYAKNKGLEQ